MTAINFDRDLRHLSLGAALAVTTQSANELYYTNSSGIVHEREATAYLPETEIAFQADRYAVFGLHMRAPDADRAGVYRIKADWYASASDIITSFVIGISDTVPNDNTRIFHPHLLQLAPGAHHSIDETLRLPNPGTLSSVDYSGRSLFFGVKFDNPGGAATRSVHMSLSVQNLQIKNPPYESALR